MTYVDSWSWVMGTWMSAALSAFVYIWGFLQLKQNT